MRIVSPAPAGSSSGIGKAVALAFASQVSHGKSSNTRICVTSRSSTRLQLVVNELQKLGAEASAVTGDLTVVDDCTNIVNEAVRVLHMDSIDPACMQLWLDRTKHHCMIRILFSFTFRVEVYYFTKATACRPDSWVVWTSL